MAIKQVLSNPLSNWMQGQGPESDVVVSSRIRLARNLEDRPFPHSLSEQAAEELLATVNLALDDNCMGEIAGNFELIPLDKLTLTERQIIVEKHLASPQHMEKVKGRAVIVSDDESLSIMVNEEDHLRIQVLLPALQLEEAWTKANSVDDCLEQRLDYSFCEQHGYLTACPTNVGTGLRASVMVHLPALVLGGQINSIITAISQLGLAVRGYYGEGTKAIGNLFQISNQITLGQTEEEIIKNLLTVTRQIITQERTAREAIFKNNQEQLADRVYRSVGILSYARIITSEEALTMFSDLRLGVSLGILQALSHKDINELTVMIRPAFLQNRAGREMGTEERDSERARIIRSKLEKIKK